ncbi:MAG: hypothetical protein IAF02_14820 [Anaerolineae bacterium]|nr:hypothetical protein [Anaerolineae bacterium]
MSDEPAKTTEAQESAQFNWLVYSDATFAGLAILIPIPLLDVAFEQFFWRRMPRAIARQNGIKLSPRIQMELNRGRFSCLQSCLMAPILLTLLLLKRIFKTILYFLTIKESSDLLSLYWHRAFLLDYMCKVGYFQDEETAVIAAEALREILETITTSPLTQLARQVIALPRHILRSLRRVRRGKTDEDIEKTRTLMARTWDNFSDYFVELAEQYEQTFAKVKRVKEMQRIQTEE